MKYIWLFLLLVACTHPVAQGTAPAVFGETQDQEMQAYTLRIVNGEPEALSLVVEKGTLSLEIVNLDNTTQLFIVEGMGDVVVPANGRAHMDLTLDKRGTYEYGMKEHVVKGLLTVQ